MVKLLEYRGHIRNWKELLTVLHIESGLSREEREKEIVTKAYEKWGLDCGNHLYGMFAFLLADGSKKIAVRDPFGAKPFFYYLTKDGELCASHSIRKIMQMPGFEKALDEEALELFLTFSYPAGEKTLFDGVKKLMPGRCLIWENGKIELYRYWQPDFTPDESLTEEQWCELIHETALKLAAESKEPTEIAESFLSGGVDSSYLAAIGDVNDVNSVAYEDKRFDESYLAEETANLLGKEFHRCIVTPEQYFAEVPYVMYEMELPFADASSIAFSLGCKATAKHTKLVYSGEAADEFFCGYHIFHNAEKYAANLEERYIGNTNIMKEDEKKRILKNYRGTYLPIEVSKPLFEQTKGMDPLSKMQNVDVQIYFEGDIQLNVDKMSSACGLEVRMPLLDMRMFEIAQKIPPRMKISEEQTKVIFRKAAGKVLPEEIAQRRKLGFIVPIRIWLADERYNADVVAKLTGESAEKFFHVDEILKIWKAYLGGEDLLWRKVWVIYTFLVWYEEYFVKR